MAVKADYRGGNLLFAALASACADRASDLQYCVHCSRVRMTDDALRFAAALMDGVPDDRCYLFIRAVCHCMCRFYGNVLEERDPVNSYALMEAPSGAPALNMYLDAARLAACAASFGIMAHLPCGWLQYAALMCDGVLRGTAVSDA